MGYPNPPNPPIGAVTPADLISKFVEFSVAQGGIEFLPKYPASQIQFYLDWAYLSLNPRRWGPLLPMGVQLFAAHYCVLEAQAQDQVNQGGEPGMATGLISSTSAGGVSVSFDTSTPANPEDGELNLTVYGTRFARLKRQLGAGSLTVTGGDCYPAGTPAGGYYAPGWPWL